MLIGLRTKKNYFVTDGQKRDYLSLDSQRARGATNKTAVGLVDSRLPSPPYVPHSDELNQTLVV